MNGDPVTWPDHYNVPGQKETIDIIKDSLTPEEFRGFCVGNMIKYRDRAKHKGHESQDMAKAKWYERMSKGDDPRVDDR